MHKAFRSIGKGQCPNILIAAHHWIVAHTLRYFWRDALIAGSCAALLSGIPSTLYAWITGGDVMEATRAAGAMLIPAASTDRELFIAATLVHAGVSLFWTLILVPLLPRRHTFIWAIVALACIAVLDLHANIESSAATTYEKGFGHAVHS